MKNFGRKLLAGVVATTLLGSLCTVQAAEVYGRGEQAIYVAASEFSSSQADCGLNYYANYYFYRSGGTGSWCGYYEASLDLPEGALIKSFAPFYFDNDATYDVTVSLQRNYATYGGGGTPTYTAIGSTSSSGNSANYQMSLTSINAGSGHTVDSYLAASGLQQGYSVRLILPTASTNLMFRGVWIFWNRQAAPAPASASFTDVPTGHPFFNEVQQLVKSGVTQGCGGGNYCPDQAVTRGQMAAFMTRALGLHWDYYTEAP
jgi:hypothetical protein